jgi:hypothetical protein
MSIFLDGERLEGPHVARISARPHRSAVPFDSTHESAFLDAVRIECQVWGGASNLLLPTNADGQIPDLYRTILPGAQIDTVVGNGYDPEMQLDQPLEITRERNLSREQLAAGLLKYRKQSSIPPLELVRLGDTDPWKPIYAACLGLLPESVNPQLVRSGNWLPDIAWADFAELRVVEGTGSLEDLLGRSWPQEPVLSPRKLSMTKLSYVSTASSTIRHGKHVLPDPHFARYDAGPNIAVVCSPGSTEDLALLWNLRAAHGDNYAVPIGLPLADFSRQSIQTVALAAGLARNGISASSLYVTSASVAHAEMAEVVGDLTHVSVHSAQDMVQAGTVLGFSRDEVLVWQQGVASYKPLDDATDQNIFSRRNINDLLMMQYDVSVPSAPLPLSDDYRVDPLNGGFYADAFSTWSSPRYGRRMARVQWPSRELIANSLASIRHLELRESAPGIAARIFIQKMGGIHEASMLCHAPLLGLLEEMSTRHGFGWYKKRLRQLGLDAGAETAVGTAIDELPEKSFHDFKRALGNSDPVTRRWLSWAERANVVIKGFPLQCPICGAKQWIPVANFNPPVTCRGCAEEIQYPFGDRPGIDFKYRLSEQSRRLYESDAMGHVLVTRYFSLLFDVGSSGRLIGLHPGMSVRRPGADNDLGEADLLMLTRRGDFVPIEVKRSASGLTDPELQKLETLANSLASPWSGVAYCQYAADLAKLASGLPTLEQDGTYSRIALSYDQLLSPMVVWGAGDDPFSPNALTRSEISEREKGFVSGLAARGNEDFGDWLTYSMLRRHSAKDEN